MKYCGQCKSFFAGEIENCPRDNFILEEMDIKDLVGRELDTKYNIEFLLGAGGMGTVFKARHKFIGNEVAIKVIHPEMAVDKNVEERFLREARAAATIDHINAIRVSDFGKVGDMLYLVMEFIQGESMKEYLERKQQLELSETVHIMNQVAAALDIAHSFQIIHRDLKPDNIMFKTGLKGERIVKVVDFGIAKIKSSSDDGSISITGAGTILGTAKYMSPEQCQAAPIDHRSDIYSLGVVVYEALTGQCPYGKANGMQAVVKHIMETPPSPRSLNPNIPEAVENVILKALAKQPTARYNTAGEFIKELARVAGTFCNLTQDVQASVVIQSSSLVASQSANNQTIISPIQAVSSVVATNQIIVPLKPSSLATQGNQTIIGVTPDNIASLVKKHFDSHTLAEELEKHGKFSTIKALEILESISNALESSYNQGISHIDLHLSNIIVKETSLGKYEVKLLDLELAKIHPANLSEQLEVRQLTVEMQNLNTSYYIPIEHKASKTEKLVDEQADVYSFGIIFYELISGQKLQKLACENTSIPSLNELDENVSKEFSEVIAKAMSTNKQDRQQNIKQLFVELKKAVTPNVSIANSGALEQKEVFDSSSQLKSLLSTTKIIIKHISGSKSGQIENFSLGKYQGITFGRESSSNVSYDPYKDTRVARQQAKIIVDNTSLGFYIVDNDSRNGTYVNNKKIKNSAKIKPEDVIKFGYKGPEFIFDLDPRPVLLKQVNIDNYQFPLTLLETDIISSTKSLFSCSLNETLVIKHIKGSKMGEVNSFATKDLYEITIGREPMSIIRFSSNADSLVSNRHAKICLETANTTKFILVDLNSRNGTYLNDQRVSDRMAIKSGDKIRLGVAGPEFEISLC